MVLINGIELENGMYFLHKRYLKNRECVVIGIGPKWMTFERIEDRFNIVKIPTEEAILFVDKIIPSPTDLEDAYQEHAQRLLAPHFDFSLIDIDDLFEQRYY